MQNIILSYIEKYDCPFSEFSELNAHINIDNINHSCSQINKNKNKKVLNCLRTRVIVKPFLKQFLYFRSCL